MHCYSLEYPDAVRLFLSGRPHPGGEVLGAGDQEAGVLREGHAVDAPVVVAQGLGEGPITVQRRLLVAHLFLISRPQ